jgi:NADP-dependent 3-hydroxy acid dehydrogenase YdfG
MKKQPAKVALVTGASSGIGAAIARRLADDGLSVMAAGRDAGRTNELASESPSIRAWIGDLATSDSCSRLVADCVKTLGRLDVLVNNAGIYHLADAETVEIWSQTIAINRQPLSPQPRVLPHSQARASQRPLPTGPGRPERRRPLREQGGLV